MYMIGQDFIWFPCPSWPKHCCLCGGFPAKSCPAARWCWAPRMANAEIRFCERCTHIQTFGRAQNPPKKVWLTDQVHRFLKYTYIIFNLTHRWGTTWLNWPIEMSCFAFLSSIRDSSVPHTLHISECLFTWLTRRTFWIYGVISFATSSYGLFDEYKFANGIKEYLNDFKRVLCVMECQKRLLTARIWNWLVSQLYATQQIPMRVGILNSLPISHYRRWWNQPVQ